MARTKKKELQKVKAAVAKSKRKGHSLSSYLDYGSVNLTTERSRRSEYDKPSTSFSHDGAYTDKEKLERPSTKMSSRTSSPVKCTARKSIPLVRRLPKQTARKSLSSSCDDIEIKDYNRYSPVNVYSDVQRAAFTLQTGVVGDNKVPIVILRQNTYLTLGCTKSTDISTNAKRSSSVPSSPSKKITPVKQKRQSWSSRPSRSCSPRNGIKTVNTNRSKSPKNIFEKFVSETDSQAESDSELSFAKNIPTDKSETKERKINISFDVSALKKLTGSKSKSKLEEESNSKRQTRKSPKSLEKLKTTPKQSPKVKEETHEKKRIRSPKLLTNDMILLPLVDHRKPRTSSKSEKKCENSKSDKKKSPDDTEIDSDTILFVRKLTFSEDKNLEINQNNNSLESASKNDITMDCEPVRSVDPVNKSDLSTVVSESTLQNDQQNCKQNCSLLKLINRINSRINDFIGPVNFERDSKTNENDSDSGDEELQMKDGENKDSSDETLPAVDSPENNGASSKQSSGHHNCSVSTSLESSINQVSVDRNYLKTKFIGNYVIPKPNDTLSVVHFPSTVLLDKELETKTHSSRNGQTEMDFESMKYEIDTDKCEIDTDKCEIDTDKCEMDTDKCEIDTDKCEIDADKCEIDTDKCEIDTDKCEIDTDKCEIDTDKCEIDMNVCEINADKGEINAANFSNSKEMVGNILCNLLTHGRKSPIPKDIDETPMAREHVEPTSSKLEFISKFSITGNNGSLHKDSAADDTSGSTPLISPKCKNKQETKEPLPISILSRHEQSESSKNDSAFICLNLEKYLSHPSNRILGLGKDDSVKPLQLDERSASCSKNGDKNEYEGFEPDFDEIDGALFLSFSTEEALQAHISVETKAKWDKDSSTFLGISRMLECQKQEANEQTEGHTPTSHGKLKTLRGQHMRWRKYQRLFHKALMAIFDADQENPQNLPEKTKDITKIKGWKNKFKNKFGSYSSKRIRNDNEFDYNYWSPEDDEPIVLNSSGSELEYDEEDEPIVVEYTEAMVPPLPEIPQLSRQLRKMMIKRLGYDEEDELIILKLGGRRITKLGKMMKEEELENGVEAEDTPREKKKRIRRRKKDLALALSDTMVSNALEMLQLPPDDSPDGPMYVDDHESGIEELPDDHEEKIDEQEVVEVQVRAVDASDIVYDLDKKEPQDCVDGDNKTVCDKPGCRYGCICHLCYLSALIEPDNNEQATVCDKEYCRLGCICDSLGNKLSVLPKTPHCGNLQCMLECICDKDNLDASICEKKIACENNGDEILPVVPHDSTEKKSKRRGVRNRNAKEECVNKKIPVPMANQKGTRRLSSLSEVPIDPPEPDNDPEYKQRIQKRRTERFSNLPKRESTYRVAKNLDAVNRKAMMVYSVSECYSEQKSSRKRKGGDSLLPDVVIERADDVDEDDQIIDDVVDYKPVKKRSRKQSQEPRQDEFEISGVDAIKESVEEAGCELRRVLTMDLPLGSSKLQAQVNTSPSNGSTLAAILQPNQEEDDLQVQKDEPEMKILDITKQTNNMKLQGLKRQRLLEEQLLKEKELHKISELKDIKPQPKREMDCRWHTQMVCLKPNPRPGDEIEKDVEDEIKLLEFIANCNWDKAKPQILSKVAQCLRPGDYPSTRRMLVGDFYVEILPKADKPPIIPPELKCKLPSMMYSIRIKVTCRQEFYQQVMKSQKVIAPADAAQGFKPAIIQRSRPILSVPILKKLNHSSAFKKHPYSTSPVSSASSLPTGGISAFSRLQISQPGQSKFTSPGIDSSVGAVNQFNFPTCSSDVVDLTMEDSEQHTNGQKRKKRKQKKDSQVQPSAKKKHKNIKSKLNMGEEIYQCALNAGTQAIVGPFELTDLKTLKTSNQSSVLKLVTPNLMIPPSVMVPVTASPSNSKISHPVSSQDLIAVPIQIGTNFSTIAPLVACAAAPLKNLITPKTNISQQGKSSSPLDLSTKKLVVNGLYNNNNNCDNIETLEEEILIKVTDGPSLTKIMSTSPNNQNKANGSGSLYCKEEWLNDNVNSDEDCIAVENDDISFNDSEYIIDEDSRSSCTSELSSSFYSSISGADALLDESIRGKDLENEDEVVEKRMKFCRMKREQRRRQTMRTLLRRLKCVVFPDFVPGQVEKIHQWKLLQETMNVIQQEEELVNSLVLELDKEENNNRILAKRMLRLMENMWKDGCSRDSITRAVELTDQNVPARLVSRVIDSLQKFSNKDRNCETDSTIQHLLKKHKNMDVMQNFNTCTSSGAVFSKMDPICSTPQSGSMILATLAGLNRGSVQKKMSTSTVTSSSEPICELTVIAPFSPCVTGDDEQVVNLVSDDSVVSLNSSRSCSPVEGVDLDQVTEENPDHEQNISDNVNCASMITDGKQQEHSLASLHNINNKLSDFFEAPKIDKSQETSKSEVLVEDSSQEISDCVASAGDDHSDNLLDIADAKPVSDTVKYAFVNQEIQNGNSVTDSVNSAVLKETKDNLCDLLDLIDKSLPGNLELYEDISDGEISEATLSAKNVNLNIDPESLVHGNCVPSVSSSVFPKNDSTTLPICDSIVCVNDKSESSETVFKLNEAKYPLSTLNY